MGNEEVTEFISHLRRISIFSPEYKYDGDLFAKESAGDKEPSFNWTRLYGKEQAEKGVEMESDPDWSDLHPLMRGQIVFNYYLGEIREFALVEAPDVWPYILTHIKSFVPNKRISALAMTHEGQDYALVNPNVLIAEAKIGSRKRLAEMVAVLAHEAKHLEFFDYKRGSKPLPEGMDSLLSQEGFGGDMQRERDCWEFHQGVYEGITGELPDITWEDMKDHYKNKYS